MLDGDVSEVPRLRSRCERLGEALRPFAERAEEARTGDVWDRAASGLGTDRAHFEQARAVLAETEEP